MCKTIDMVQDSLLYVRGDALYTLTWALDSQHASNEAEAAASAALARSSTQRLGSPR